MFFLKKFKYPRWPRFWQFIQHKLLPKRGRPFDVAASVFWGVSFSLIPAFPGSLPVSVLICVALRLPWVPCTVSSFIAIPPVLYFGAYPLGYFIGSWILDPPPLKGDFVQSFLHAMTVNWGGGILDLWQDAQGHFIAFLLGMAIECIFFGLLAAVIVYFMMIIKQKRARALKMVQLFGEKS